MELGDVPEVKQLLRTHPELLSWRYGHGFTCLHLATCSGNTAIVKYLLNEHHMDPNDVTIEYVTLKLLNYY